MHPNSLLARHADLVFACKTFLAAVLALLTALWLDLPRPYWAMATVYITSQPLAGATSSKALYRVLGTVAGAVATVAMVPNLVDAPELLCLAMALWVGLCLYLSLLDRQPRSYAFMLTGYTVALIGFPSVSDPGGIFDTALARVEEITLGIVCATLVSTVVLPRRVAPAVAQRVESWLKNARDLARDVLAGTGEESELRAHRLQLAADAVEIDALAGHLSHDRASDANAVRGLQMLRRHMMMLLPLLASITDRLEALGGGIRQTRPALAELLDGLGQWLTADIDGRPPAEPLRAAIAGLRPDLNTGASWEEIVLANLSIRLRELVDLSDDCRALERAIADGRDPAEIALAFEPEAGVMPSRHRDHALALWSAAGAAIAILLCCALWIATGWADGASAPMMAAVGCSFFAAQDDPAKGIKSFGWWSLVSIVVVAVYLFAIIPAISHVEMLIAALAPTFLLYGMLIGRPNTNFIGMALAANTATLLALQSTYSADFQSYVNSSIAFMLGMAMAAVVTRLARGFGAEWIAQRLMRTSWTTLAVTAERRGRNDRAAFAGLMLDRLGLLTQRIAAIDEADRGDVVNLNQLRVGLNIIDLRRARRSLAPATLEAIDDMLTELAIAARAGGAMPTELLTRIDAALSQSVGEPAGKAREDALIGITGIRRGLFPQAPAYRDETSGRRRLVA
ncbi:MAG TPA: FUSC family protein [Bradyrhizobium sp.]|nr:FUSC family protein [Bradyrhizobium sp.]